MALVDKRPRVVVVGAGRWGKNLVRAVDRLGALAAVVERDDERRRQLDARLEVPVLPELDARSVSELDLDAAMIATPAESHTHVALRCLDLGLDLFVEKPLALSVEDAELIVAEAERRERVLMTGHILLFHPAVRALKELVDAGELGEIRYLYSNRLNLGRVRREENILWSFAPHDIAAMIHLLGTLPHRVHAVGGSWLQPGIVDVTVTHLSFPGGEQGHVFVSWLHPYKEQKLILVGSRQMAVFDDLAPGARLRVMDSGVDVGDDGIPSERQGEHRIVPLPDEEPLLNECRHFLACCRDRSRPLTDGRHGVDVLRILAAAEQEIRRRTFSSWPNAAAEAGQEEID